MCDSASKPLMLFHLVRARGVTNALVFTKSAESTTRLVRLFEFFGAAVQRDGASPVVARAYSSDLAPAERKAILEQFKNQEVHMCVSSSFRSRVVLGRRSGCECVTIAGHRTEDHSLCTFGCMLTLLPSDSSART